MPQHWSIAILVNPLAGSGRSIKLADDITRLLRDRAVAFVVFKENWPSMFDGFTDIWIVGGDGTLNYFINHYPFPSIPLAVFPGGSGNDFQFMLYGNQTIIEMIYTIFQSTPKKVDAGICNGQYFLNSAGAGFDGKVVHTIRGKNKSKGKGSFFRAVLSNIFTYKEREYTITDGDKTWSGKFLIVSIMNSRRAGGGFYIAPKASISDGKFDITLIDKLNIFKRVRYLPVIERGKHEGLPFIRQFLSAAITIESDDEMDTQLDGEYYSFKKMEIRTLPGVLTFRY
ncbi:MAG: YegS/Rv2252/BmrU family lipid kinase [Chitinophagaceae bacterium]|nr:YegS/Rv2252/BmrU family lipid kinase [Chitinophagaceae bacterium]